MCVIKVSWLEEFSFWRGGDLIPESKEVKGVSDHIQFRKKGSAEGQEVEKHGKDMKRHGSKLAQLQYHPGLSGANLQDARWS